MDEFGSFAGVIALWIGVSCGLWWLHRRSVHAGQRRQMRQAVRAVAYTADGQNVFDTIRRLPYRSPTDAALTAETYSLLKRIQQHSAFFDKVNVLRIDMLAGFGVEDYPPLSEILHVRRDLWAASEIVLVEDLSSFGESFAEEGAYERFRADAAALLFKTDGAGTGEEDVIDLRLSLARGEAERFVAGLKDAIRLARERDRLPTFAEIIAYPIAAIKAVPAKVRIARAFLREFYGYAAEIAGAIRRSEAMERGVGELRRAREELPQRLVTGFERASDAARQSASGLRRHYDFLVAAHDFQAKYEQALRRAPEITERGRQFIARLELAEHSERLRLTSANFLIWLTRQMATGLAHFIAGLQGLHTVLSETPPGVLATALVAPTPIRGRHVPAFRSYRMALGANGLTEPRPRLPSIAGGSGAPVRKRGEKPMIAASAKENGKRGKAPAAKAPKSAPVVEPARVKEPARPSTPAPRAKSAASSKQAKADDALATEAKPARTANSKPNAVKADAKAETLPAAKPTPSMPAAKAPAEAAKSPSASPPVAPPVAKQPVKELRKTGKRGAIPADSKPPEPAVAQNSTQVVAAALPAPKAPAGPTSATVKRGNAAILPPPAELTAEDSAADNPAPLAFPVERRRSFIDRLLGRRPAEPTIGELLAAAWEREHAAELGDKVAAAIPAATAPTLLAKLSELPAEDLAEDIQDEDGAEVEPIDEADAEDDSGDDPESLTSSVLEVQAKLAAKPAQIRSFPWLRG